VRGEGFKLENRKSVEAAIYLSASVQFERRQSKSKRKERKKERNTKSEREINKGCSQIERTRS